AVEMREVRLPLRRPFVATHGVESERSVILVRIQTDGAVGWGECSALSLPSYTEEWLQGAWLVLEELLLPGIQLGEVPTIVGNPMARTAVEMALLDARLKSAQISLASHLGATKSEVPVGAVIGLMPNEASLAAEVERAVEAGYRRIKLKVAPGSARRTVELAREIAGSEMPLFVDANGAFDRTGMAELCALEELAVALIEQPFGADEIGLHADLASKTSTAICLDESLRSVVQTREALVAGACSVVCLKAPRLGGYERALEAHDIAREYGADCWVGGMLDTSLARAANAAVAALPGCSSASDLSSPENLLAADIAAPVLISNGYARVPTQPGIGVEMDEDAIKKFTVRSSSVRP
ncbi:MAG: o-succinylbenzoate synthase, partial [Acidimicrobiales bacterium]